MLNVHEQRPRRSPSVRFDGPQTPATVSLMRLVNEFLTPALAERGFEPFTLAFGEGSPALRPGPYKPAWRPATSDEGLKNLIAVTPNPAGGLAAGAVWDEQLLWDSPVWERVHDGVNEAIELRMCWDATPNAIAFFVDACSGNQRLDLLLPGERLITPSEIGADEVWTVIDSPEPIFAGPIPLSLPEASRVLLHVVRRQALPWLASQRATTERLARTLSGVESTV
jgi:hypothetical protein